MVRLSLFLVAVVAFGAAAASLRRVCYYTNWAQYRNGPGKFFPENVEPSLCTHIIYAFAKIVDNHLVAFEWNDESTPWMKGMYERFHEIKKKNPSVKLMLAVGGWNMGSAPFTKMATSAATRQKFAKTTVAFLRNNTFDGIDMDWEYPANRGSPPEDKHKFTLIIQALRDEFAKESVPAGKDRLMISAAVAAGKEKIDTAYEIPEISGLLDFINLMSYDLHGSWEDHTGHNSPLYARSSETGNDSYLNVDWAAQYWVLKGAPREKLNIGMGLYGRTFQLPWSHSSDTIGCPAKGAGSAGRYTSEAGFMSYYEICEKIKNGATRRYEQEQKVPYIVQNDLWVGYDDPDSLRLKVDYVKREHFGGIMVWALDLDDFSGACGEGKYPLMHAIVDELESPVSPVQSTQPTQDPITKATQGISARASLHTNPPVTTAAPIVATTSLRRVCYYTNWAQYRNGPGKFFPQNVDPTLCTHIIYAFAKLVNNQLAAFEWNDESTPWMKGMYEKFHEIKKQNPSVKLLLAVGGWNMGSAPFTKMAASAATRQKFATTTVAFLRKNKFDGIDMDWEYPANRGSPSGDKHKFTLILQALRDEFAKESVPAGTDRLMISAAVAAGKEKIDTAYEIPEISGLLDFINLMSYDLHGSWEDHTGHNSPLYARSSETGNDTYLNVDWAAQYWVQKGAPREKLNIGMGLYGRTFQLPWSHPSDTIGCPAKGAGSAGTYTREAGFMSYYEICEKLKNGATRRYEQEQKVPYIVQNDLWVGYDDPDSLRLKVDYVKQEHFGGVMVWALDLDDFSGMCGQGKYPLMHAIVDELEAPSGPVSSVQSTQPTQDPVTTATQRISTRAFVQTNPPVTTKAPIVTTIQETTIAKVQMTTSDSATAANTAKTTTQAAPFTTQAQDTTTSKPATAATTARTTTQAAPVTTQAQDTTTAKAQVTTSKSATAATTAKTTTQAAPFTTQAKQPTTAKAQVTTSKPATVATTAKTTTQAAPITTQAKQTTTAKVQVTTSKPATSATTARTTTQAAPITTQAKQTTTAKVQVTTSKPATSATTARTTTQAAPITTQAPGSNSNTHQLTHVTNNEFNCAVQSDGYYASPTSCSHYYVCAAGMAFRANCHPGFVFNTATSFCDFPEHAKCTPSNNAAPKTTTRAAVTTRAPATTQAPVTTKAPVPTTTQKAHVDPAHFCEGKTDGFHKDPADCRHYYQCYYHKSLHITCAEGTAYQESIKGCNWAANVPDCP